MSPSNNFCVLFTILLDKSETFSDVYRNGKKFLNSTGVTPLACLKNFHLKFEVKFSGSLKNLKKVFYSEKNVKNVGKKCNKNVSRGTIKFWDRINPELPALQLREKKTRPEGEKLFGIPSRALPKAREDVSISLRFFSPFFPPLCFHTCNSMYMYPNKIQNRSAEERNAWLYIHGRFQLVTSACVHVQNVETYL